MINFTMQLLFSKPYGYTTEGDLCTDTDKNGFSFILVNHEESAKMSYELLILLKFKLQYIYYNTLIQLYLAKQGKLNSN